jgi:AraC-like DNA-binding protein
MVIPELILRKNGRTKISRRPKSERSSDGVLSAVWSANTNPSGANGRLLPLEQMAAMVSLSPFHFARQFKAATGLPPHQFLITRRVERAQQILRGRGNLSLAQVAIGVGFSDQSQLCFHFKRIVGVTPGRFRASAKST